MDRRVLHSSIRRQQTGEAISPGGVFDVVMLDRLLLGSLSQVASDPSMHDKIREQVLWAEERKRSCVCRVPKEGSKVVA